jgi:4-amino-4-deoxy-L-arabinose transferase-like glycosyltransferase
LELAAPPVAAAFELDLMVNDGTRLYSPVPAGWPAVLAIGSFFGVPWLVNPVLGGASVLLTWRLVSSLYDARTARLATLLLASSPWLIFLSMSFMTHLLPLFCALVAAVAVDETRRRRATWPALVGGAALGLIALTRPFDALAAAAATGLWALWTGIPSRRLGPAVALTATSIAVAALTLPYNRHFTGSATQFPLMAYTDVLYGEGTNALGFGANRGLGWPGLDPFPGHGPVDVVVNAMLNLAAINQELFGWGVGSLVLVALLVAGRGMTRTDAAMAGAGGLVIVLHSFYWFAGGPDFAARYWFLTIVPLCVLSARAVVHLEGDGSGASRGRVASAVVALSALSLVVFVPWRSVDKYHDYRGMEPGVRVLDRKIKFGRSLVLVRGNRHPDYASAAFYNPLDWDADAPVYAWDRSPETRREVLAAFPDRPVWVLDGPTVTGGGYRVARGPIAPDSAQRVLLGP